jgi:hypothetical protein
MAEVKNKGTLKDPIYKVSIQYQSIRDITKLMLTVIPLYQQANALGLHIDGQPYACINRALYYKPRIL